MTQRELKAFITWCRKQGIARVKAGDVEVDFAPAPPGPPPSEPHELSPEAAEVEARRQREALLYGSS